MLGHEALADSMAGVQGAVPHHLVLEGLTASVAISDFPAVTATADHVFVVLKLENSFRRPRDLQRSSNKMTTRSARRRITWF